MSHRPPFRRTSRADIRRLVALEAENADLRDRLDRQHTRFAELVDARDQGIARMQRQATEAAAEARRHDAERRGDVAEQLRRERAGREAEGSAQNVQRAQLEIDRLRRAAKDLAEERGAAEAPLSVIVEGDRRPSRSLRQLVSIRVSEPTRRPQQHK